jgi:hypothetical protein
MTHPLVLALYPSPAAAAVGARAVHACGVTRDRISIVTRNHDEEGALAEQMDATPGADIEDSRFAARLGELSAHVLAAIALVLPGIGPIVASGPLAAGLGEAAGHVAGRLGVILEGAGVPEERADRYEHAVREGAILIGVHVRDSAKVAGVCQALERHGGTDVTVAEWSN